MRDATPKGDGANTESQGTPASGSAAAFDASSIDNRTARSVERARAFYQSILNNAPVASAGPSADVGSASAPVSDPVASPAPDTGETSKVEAAPADAVAPVSEIAPSRTLFDLRKALKSAVRVLTKERSFARDVQALAEPEGNPESLPSAEPDAEASTDLKPAGLSGHTSSVAIPEVLGFLAQLRKSGTLWIWNEREQFRIQLVEGNVTFACDETPNRGWLIGEVLISQGALDAARFEDFLKQPREPGPLGDALIKAGLVDKQALTGAVQFQAQRVFNLAYGLNDANFCFDANRRHDDLQGIRISVTQMLFESARTRDESERRLSTVFDDPFSK